MIGSSILDSSGKDVSSNYSYKCTITNNPKKLSLTVRSTTTYKCKYKLYTSNVTKAPLTIRVEATNKKTPTIKLTKDMKFNVNAK